ncbi:MAG: zinc carboxypeptidase, partial [Thermoplasmata archaeon]|nr:zinc carboxypeptidase [Thermoplasmata archaeon]
QASYPDLVEVTVIGTSWEGRDIHAVKVSDNVTVDEAEPEVLIMGMHHAREWMSVEVPMYYLNDLVHNYGTDARATWMVDNREIYIVPIINPDGYVYSQTIDWRKNRRDNGDGTWGVDLNRNYDGAQNGDTDGNWGEGAGTSHVTSSEVYCGPAPFSEPETQAIRDLVIARDFQCTISYHSHAEYVIWPWGYTDSGTVMAPHSASLSELGNQYASFNGYTTMQSGDWYPTTGDTDDWMYGHNWYNLGRYTAAHTIELDHEFQPPVTQIGPTCELNLPVNYHSSFVAGNNLLDSPVITHTPLNDTVDTIGPYTVSVDIATPHGLAPGETKLFWRNTGAWNEVVMTNMVGDTWEADMPGQSDGTWVHYYVETEDVNTHRSSEPPYTPYADHDFFVGNDVVSYDMTLDSLEWRI